MLAVELFLFLTVFLMLTLFLLSLSLSQLQKAKPDKDKAIRIIVQLIGKVHYLSFFFVGLFFFLSMFDYIHSPLGDSCTITKSIFSPSFPQEKVNSFLNHNAGAADILDKLLETFGNNNKNDGHNLMSPTRRSAIVTEQR